MKHPKDKYVQVVVIKDPKYEEVAAVFIELKEGAHCTENEIIDFCRGKIASFKLPKFVRFVKTWPMSATKVQKFKLREQLERELEVLRESCHRTHENAPAVIKKGEKCLKK